MKIKRLYTASAAMALLTSMAPAGAANPNCSGHQIDLVNVEFSGVQANCVATTSIATGASVGVTAQADVLFTSPLVRLGPGFHVDGGSRFRITPVPTGSSINSTSQNATPATPLAAPPRGRQRELPGAGDQRSGHALR